MQGSFYIFLPDRISEPLFRGDRAWAVNLTLTDLFTGIVERGGRPGGEGEWEDRCGGEEKYPCNLLFVLIIFHPDVISTHQKAQKKTQFFFENNIPAIDRTVYCTLLTDPVSSGLFFK